MVGLVPPLDWSVTFTKNGTALIKREAVSMEKQVQESKLVTKQPLLSREEKQALYSLEKIVSPIDQTHFIKPHHGLKKYSSRLPFASI